jgi:hypothetical protein
MVRSRARTVGALAVIGLGSLLPPAALAQSPWTVTVTPRLNPLPIGNCSPIQITVVDPSTRDAPRNSRGFRVTIAHFDMTVAGAAVVGQQVDANFWQVCACQGGVAGTPVTVTATYPAQSLDAATSIPGVAFQQTATLTLVRPNGTSDPIACTAAASVASAPAPATVMQPRIAVAVTSPPAPTAGTGATSVLPPSTVGQPITRGTVAPRQARYAPGPVTVSPSLRAQGTWYEPGPVQLNPILAAQGSWFVGGPVTVSPTLSATGSWLAAPQRLVPALRTAPQSP